MSAFTRRKQRMLTFICRFKLSGLLTGLYAFCNKTLKETENLIWLSNLRLNSALQRLFTQSSHSALNRRTLQYRLVALRSCETLCEFCRMKHYQPPVLFTLCTRVCVCVCACMHNASADEHAQALTSMGCATSVLSASELLSFGKTKECLAFKHNCGFSQVSLSLFSVFKWMALENPNIRSSLPHLPLSFYQIHICLSVPPFLPPSLSFSLSPHTDVWRADADVLSSYSSSMMWKHSPVKLSTLYAVWQYAY